MEIQVSCHAGYQGDEYPTRFTVSGRSIEVVRVIRQWRTPERRCFRVACGDEGIYQLEQEITTGRWFCPEIDVSP